MLAHLTLPAFTLAFPALATVVRFTRAGVLETLQKNFVLYQRAMGIPAGLIVWKYVLRNSLISTVTQIGLLFGILLAGDGRDRDRVPVAGHRRLRVRGDPAVRLRGRDGLHGLCGRRLRHRESDWSTSRRQVIDPRGSRRMSTALDVLRKLLRDPAAAAGLIIILLLILIAILAPLLATHPEAVWDMNPRQRLLPPSDTLSVRHRPHGRRHLQPHPVRRAHHAS